MSRVGLVPSALVGLGASRLVGRAFGAWGSSYIEHVTSLHLLPSSCTIAAEPWADKWARNMQRAQTMELLGRVAAALVISLVLTLLMMALYQDDAPGRATRAQGSPDSMVDSR